MNGWLAHLPALRMLWADEGVDQAARVRALVAGVFEVQFESDAERALACVRDDPPALVCVGTALHTRDGTPLIRALRALPAAAGIPLLLMCPRGDEVACPGELLECADDLLLTPFSDCELAMRMRAHARLGRALASDRGKDAFLYAVDHELRTPLTAIQLWASSLRGAVPGKAELERALSAITASAQSQSRRIDDLLDMSRLARGALALQRRRLPVSTLISELWGEIEPLARAKHIKLELARAEPLGDLDVDRQRIGQVLATLLSNAIKFTGDGGRVTLSVRKQQATLEFEVSDSGEGLAPERVAQLFEGGERVTMGDVCGQPGLGIGLALSRMLVELHGGSMQVESAGVGRGASFRVRLPACVTPALEADSRPAPVQASKGSLRGRTVLLVEDHEETREAMQFVLERAGARVRSAEDGQRGLDLLGDTGRAAAFCPNVDVVVCDLGLPDMSGYEFIARLIETYQRQRLTPPPACALSAHAREADRQRAISAGFDLHIAKPLNAAALVEAVNDLCQVAVQAALSPSP